MQTLALALALALASALRMAMHRRNITPACLPACLPRTWQAATAYSQAECSHPVQPACSSQAPAGPAGEQQVGLRQQRECAPKQRSGEARLLPQWLYEPHCQQAEVQAHVDLAPNVWIGQAAGHDQAQQQQLGCVEGQKQELTQKQGGRGDLQASERAGA